MVWQRELLLLTVFTTPFTDHALTPSYNNPYTLFILSERTLYDMAIVDASADPPPEDQQQTDEQPEHEPEPEPPSDTETQIQLAPAPVPAPQDSAAEIDQQTIMPIPSISSSTLHGPPPVFSSAPPQPPPMQNMPPLPPQNNSPSPDAEMAKIYNLLNDLLEQLSVNRQASIQLHSLVAGVKVRLTDYPV